MVAGAGLVAWTLFLIRPGNDGVVICFGVLAALVVLAALATSVRWVGHPDRALDDLAPGASRIVPGLRAGAAAVRTGARRVAAARRRGWSTEQPVSVGRPEPVERPAPTGEPSEVEPGHRVVVVKEPAPRPAPEPVLPVAVLPISGSVGADDATRPLPSPRRRSTADEFVPTIPVPASSTTDDPALTELPAERDVLPAPETPVATNPSRRPSSSSGGSSTRGESGGKKQGKGRKTSRPPRRVAGRGRPGGS